MSKKRRISLGFMLGILLSTVIGVGYYSLTPSQEKIEVSQAVWDCFEDYHTPTEDGETGCLGRIERDKIIKWDQTKPVNIYVISEDEEYLNIFREEVVKVASLVGLDLIQSDDPIYSDVIVRVGNKERVLCDDFSSGCTSIPYDHFSGRIGAGTIEVPYNPDHSESHIRHVILHEMLHVLVPLRHSDISNVLVAPRPEGYPLSADLTDFMREVLEFHSHPAIKAGMSINQVRNLVEIVPSDPVAMTKRLVGEDDEKNVITITLGEDGTFEAPGIKITLIEGDE